VQLSLVVQKYVGAIYYNGDGVNKDKAKAKQYYEKGALAGCTTSRLLLGTFDFEAGSFDRAVKHWLIAASGGENAAVDAIKQLRAQGRVLQQEIITLNSSRIFVIFGRNQK
jgi:hypothetical protein